MALLPGNLINTDMGDTAQVSAGQAEGNHIGDSGGNRAPGTLELSGYLPGQRLGPGGDCNGK